MLGLPITAKQRWSMGNVGTAGSTLSSTIQSEDTWQGLAPIPRPLVEPSEDVSTIRVMYQLNYHYLGE